MFRLLTSSEIETISKVISNSVSGSGITSLFNECNVQDTSGESTKWQRIHATFLQLQKERKCSDNFLDFINHWANPIRYVNKTNEEYLEIIREVNKPLLLIGLKLNHEGKLQTASVALTLSEAEKRAESLSSKLRYRGIHPDILKFCKKEYLEKDYFHTVHEAAKSLCLKIRDKTGMTEDGSELINNAFSTKNPRLAINSLRTESERNQQNGLKEMLNGITHMVRNVTAHELRANWIVDEKETIEILSIISFLHNQLDVCVVVPSYP